MQRTIIARAIAVVTVLAVTAQVPMAEAGPFKRGGAKAVYAGNFKAKRNAHAGSGKVGNFSGGRRRKASPAQWANNYVLALYARKCLDNLFPECPK
ncbi:MAG: hypothetical protein KDJ45_09745 [Hyphomicrobiaceae bacterium]|nr:hypothetical protein [Hyphomicrobiaceae bacterium]MCC0010199.1 hypothetical protein [Hyphomicrobiaceae bacterium]